MVKEGLLLLTTFVGCIVGAPQDRDEPMLFPPVTASGFSPPAFHWPNWPQPFMNPLTAAHPPFGNRILVAHEHNIFKPSLVPIMRNQFASSPEYQRYLSPRLLIIGSPHFNAKAPFGQTAMPCSNNTININKTTDSVVKTCARPKMAVESAIIPVSQPTTNQTSLNSSTVPPNDVISNNCTVGHGALTNTSTVADTPVVIQMNNGVIEEAPCQSKAPQVDITENIIC